MSKPLKSRLTYANVVSSIAIFLILGGGSALAVTHLGKDEASIYSFVASDRRPIDPTEVDLEDGDFLVGSGFDMLAGGTGDINLVHFEYNAPDGTVATGTLVVDASFAAGDCHVTGDVIVG